MSTVSESNPWCAMISAENELGIDSQPFTTASPRSQIALSVFSLTPPPSRLRRSCELGAAHRPEIAPAADPQLLGLLEVVNRRGVGRRVDEIRLHGADRHAHLLLDGIGPISAPRRLGNV